MDFKQGDVQKIDVIHGTYGFPFQVGFLDGQGSKMTPSGYDRARLTVSNGFVSEIPLDRIIDFTIGEQATTGNPDQPGPWVFSWDLTVISDTAHNVWASGTWTVKPTASAMPAGSVAATLRALSTEQAAALEQVTQEGETGTLTRQTITLTPNSGETAVTITIPVDQLQDVFALMDHLDRPVFTVGPEGETTIRSYSTDVGRMSLLLAAPGQVNLWMGSGPMLFRQTGNENGRFDYTRNGTGKTEFSIDRDGSPVFAATAEPVLVPGQMGFYVNPSHELVFVHLGFDGQKRTASFPMS